MTAKPIIFFDTTGQFADRPGTHILRCGSPDHLDGLAKSIAQHAESEQCPLCGASTAFQGKAWHCPFHESIDPTCELCHGESESVYVISMPKSMTRSDFYDAVREVWSGALRHFDNLISVAVQAEVETSDHAITDEKSELMSRLTGKAYQTADAISCLLHAGHPDAAFALSRNLKEIEINLMAIAIDNRPDVLERFRAWAFRGMFKRERALRKLNAGELSDEDWNNAKSQYEAFARRYGDDWKRDDGWIGTNVFQRAKRAGVELDYRKYYSAASSFTHTDGTALYLPIGLSERNKGRILYGPSGVGLDVVMVTTALSVGQIAASRPCSTMSVYSETYANLHSVIKTEMTEMLRSLASIDPRNLVTQISPEFIESISDLIE